MIIAGYQGIGKSSLAGTRNGFVDLESGNFWVDGKRNDNWHIEYANIAKHLSEQGFCVFTSSHKAVREALSDYKGVKVVAYPSLKLKEEWVKRVKERYDKTELDKDYKAMMNTIEMYEENISDLMNEANFAHLEIEETDYNLRRMIMRLQGRV